MDGLFMVQVVKALVEVALMLFAARGVLALFFLPAPQKLQGNFVYQLFVKGTQPIVRLMRLLTPPFVLDRHLPFAAFGLLLVAWLGLGLAKVNLCAEALEHAACEQLAKHRAGTGVPGAGGAPGGLR
jgi:hypothetical protein